MNNIRLKYKINYKTHIVSESLHLCYTSVYINAVTVPCYSCTYEMFV